MASLKTLRLRIKSIKSTQKITKAMQMVAASKLRHAKSDMEHAATYNITVRDMLHSLAYEPQEAFTGFAKIVFGNCSANAKILSLVITSERGLCGGFNQAVLRKARADIDKLRSEGCQIKIITIGKKGRDWILSRYGADNVINHFVNPPTKSLKVDAKIIYNSILHELQNGHFEGMRIYSNKFKNAVSQIPEIKVVAPIAKVASKNCGSFELEGANLLSEVAKLYIISEIYYALLDSRTGEEAARMIAMDNATKNAGEMIQKLTLSMNRSRQASITKELIEIISGAEAV